MKTWFITGISRGLGAALARAVLARGDAVVGTVREQPAPFEAGTPGLTVLRLELDDPAAAEGAVEAAFAATGRLDVLVNNAGYGLLGAVEGATDAEVRHLFEVNLFGPFRLIRAALPRLRAQGSGHIVNVTSIAGRAPMASSGLYAAAKSAMEGLSQSLAQEVVPLGLRVTAVAPGGFRTDFLSEHSIRRSDDAMTRIYRDSVGKALDHLDGIAGRQVGDPARGADAIIAAVEAPHPPLHLLLGSDALSRTQAKMEAMGEEMATWQAVTTGTDFPEAAP